MLHPLWINANAVTICTYKFVKLVLTSNETCQKGLDRRLAKAEAALGQLTPPRQRGKRQIKDEASLLAAIERLEKKYRVQGMFSLSYTKQVTEKVIGHSPSYFQTIFI